MGAAGYPVAGVGPNTVLCGGLIITGHATTPVVTADPDSLLDPDTPTSRTSQGVYVLYFKDDWSYIGGSVNVQGVIGDMGYLTAPVYTKGANSITLVLWDESGTAVDDILVACHIDLVLKR